MNAHLVLITVVYMQIVQILLEVLLVLVKMVFLVMGEFVKVKFLLFHFKQNRKKWRKKNKNLNSIDINECDIDDTCPEHSTCVNTIGSYTCYCDIGYEDSGCTGFDFFSFSYLTIFLKKFLLLIVFF